MLLDMADPNHPAEEALERFLLNHCSETELCEVETHFLHCEDCVNRLELLETEITIFKCCLEKVANLQFTMAAGA
jgi:hypothetical protein